MIWKHDGSDLDNSEIPIFTIGEKFQNYAQFESKLKSRVDMTNEKFRIGAGSTKINKLGRDGKKYKHHDRSDIVYRYVIIECKHGGTHKTRGQGQRKTT